MLKKAERRFSGVSGQSRDAGVRPKKIKRSRNVSNGTALRFTLEEEKMGTLHTIPSPKSFVP